MQILLDCFLGWLHFGDRVKIGPTTQLAVNAELHVGAAAGSLVEIGIVLVADYGWLDEFDADNESDESKIDDERTDDWAGEEVSWQHRKASSDYMAGRFAVLYEDYGMLVGKGGGNLAEVAE